jgi:hypothetical protein
MNIFDLPIVEQFSCGYFRGSIRSEDNSSFYNAKPSSRAKRKAAARKWAAQEAA